MSQIKDVKYSHNPPKYLYCVGGTVPPNSPSYVTREADHQLFEALNKNEYCYVFNSRQKGKSSLDGKVRQRLKAEGWHCISFDVTTIGTSITSVEQWYRSWLQLLAKELGLDIQISAWWREQGDLSPLSYLSCFFEDIVLPQVEGNILISIDEIDSLLSLKFSMDDFFGFIRACYNRRSNNPDYNRLTFLLLGVASPTDLVMDKTRTPFNIGTAIDLTRLEKGDIEPFSKGLEGIVAAPLTVVDEIWEWTDGHPFITQKICNIIQEKGLNISIGSEKNKIEKIINENIVENWENKDNPEHLRTIEQRILRNGEQAGSLLRLYQAVLEKNTIVADSSQDQIELMLSGIVTKENGKIRVANRIYQKIFNKKWVETQLDKLKPYSMAMAAWKKSNFGDSSYLLNGNALQESLIWIQGKRLGKLDKSFIRASKKYAKKRFFEASDAQIIANKLECDRLIQIHTKEFQKIADYPDKIFEKIYNWTGVNQFLFEIIINDILHNEKFILKGEEAERVEKAVSSAILESWEDNSAASHLLGIRNQLFKYKRKKRTLSLYKKILSQETIIIDDRPALMDLLESRLIFGESETDSVQVSNKIYKLCFDIDWVNDELAKVEDSFLIRKQYRVEHQISEVSSVITYSVLDTLAPSPIYYLATQFTPNISNDENALNAIRTLFSDSGELLGVAGKIEQIPKIISRFEENGSFYIIQEMIKGKLLKTELKIRKWSQDSVISLMIAILEVLKKIHSVDLKHLNICPDNIIRCSDSQKLILCNFAIFEAIAARVLQTDNFGNPLKVGTPGYAAPEQQNGQNYTSVSSDLFAVGMIGIQALTGHRPTDLPDNKVTQAKIWRYAPLGGSIPIIDDGLIQIIDTLIQPEVEMRYKSANEAIKALKSFQEDNHEEKKFKDEKKKIEDEKKKIDNAKETLIKFILFLTCVGLVIGGWIFNNNRERNNLINSEILSQCKNPNKFISNDLYPPKYFDEIKLINAASLSQYACSQLLRNNKAKKDRENLYLQRGISLLVLWNQERKLTSKWRAIPLLEAASDDFERASDKLASSSFFLGVAQDIRNAGNTTADDYSDELKADFDRAIGNYLQHITDSETQAVREFTRDDLSEIEHKEIPILIKLAFFLEARSENEGKNTANAKHLLQMALTKGADSLPLRYSRAMLEARIGNYQQAIEELNDIVKVLPVDDASGEQGQGQHSELLGQVYQSRALLHLQLGIRDKSQLTFAENNFYTLVETGKAPMVPGYIPEKCLTNMFSCDIPEIVGAIAQDEDLNYGFPVFPIYDCRENPAMAIAEQALIDRGLESPSTKLCR
ncbi:MAG: AAA-like domain-containing protein [Cyanobacteria bacterium P01_F01_bin.143]